MRRSALCENSLGHIRAMKDSKEFWDKGAEKYVRSPIKDKATYEKKLAITQAHLNSNSRVLEFGCGSGATSIFHAPNVGCIVATDISSKMIDLAQKKASEAGVKNIRFLVGALDDIDLSPSSFDAVLGLNVLHLIDDIDESINQVYRLLDEEGVFVSSTSLIGEVNVFFQWLIYFMQVFGLAPYVNRLAREKLIDKLKSGGFRIESEWASSHESIFIVARKSTRAELG